MSTRHSKDKILLKPNIRTISTKLELYPNLELHSKLELNLMSIKQTVNWIMNCNSFK